MGMVWWGGGGVDFLDFVIPPLSLDIPCLFCFFFRFYVHGGVDDVY